MILDTTLRLGYLEQSFEDYDNSILQTTLKTEDVTSAKHVTPRNRSSSRPHSGKSEGGSLGSARSTSRSRKSSKDAGQTVAKPERSSSRQSRKAHLPPEPVLAARRSPSKDGGYTRNMAPVAKESMEVKEKRESKQLKDEKEIPDEPSSPQLEWSHRPNRIIQKEGSVVYQVSTASKDNSEREHRPYLVRTTRIEPLSPAGAGRPPMPSKKREQIVVTEKDLQRCGGDLNKLRECNIVREPWEKPPSPEKLELSFKSAFDLKCREGADMRNPWEGKDNPDDSKEMNVADLVLNQVWVKALSPRKLEKAEDEDDEKKSPVLRKDGSVSPPNERAHRSASASTRASSADPGLQTGDGYLNGREERRVRRRDSHRNLPPPMAVTALPAVEVSRRRSSRGRASSKRSSSSGPIPDSVQRAMKFTSPIKPLTFDEPEEARAPPPADQWSSRAREASKFLTYARNNGDTRAVWLSLDHESGEIETYERAAGSRLESAMLAGRSSVPLAGTGDGFDGTIVTLGRGAEPHRLRCVDGSHREVRRYEVTAYSYEMWIRLLGPRQGQDQWRFAGETDTEVEEKHVKLYGTELVAPPSPSLPPVGKNHQNYFINAAAEWAELGY